MLKIGLGPVGVSKAVVEVFANAREALREDSDAEDERDVDDAGADDELDDPDYAPMPSSRGKAVKGSSLSSLQSTFVR